MFENPMESLPAYGALLKNHFKLNAKDDDRRICDLIAAVLDYLVGRAWSNLGLWPGEEEKHRKGTSILEIQKFLDWAVIKLIEDMDYSEEQKEEIDKECMKAIEDFMSSGDEEEEDGDGNPEH